MVMCFRCWQVVSLEKRHIRYVHVSYQLQRLFSCKKQLNVDFTRMHDHRDAHLTYDRANCWFHQASLVRVLTPDPIHVSSKHCESSRFEMKVLSESIATCWSLSVVLPVSITTKNPLHLILNELLCTRLLKPWKCALHMITIHGRKVLYNSCALNRTVDARYIW